MPRQFVASATKVVLPNHATWMPLLWERQCRSTRSFLAPISRSFGNSRSCGSLCITNNVEFASSEATSASVPKAAMVASSSLLVRNSVRARCSACSCSKACQGRKARHNKHLSHPAQVFCGQAGQIHLVQQAGIHAQQTLVISRRHETATGATIVHVALAYTATSALAFCVQQTSTLER